MKIKIEWTDRTWDFIKEFTKENYRTITHIEPLEYILDRKKFPIGSKVFVNSVNDTFQEYVDFSKLQSAFAYLSDRKDLKFYFLTKNPKNMIRFFDDFVRNFDDEWGDSRILDTIPYNCRFGVTIENQETADERIPELLKIRDFFYYENIILFASIKPSLELLSIDRYLNDCGLDFVIVNRDKRSKK